MIIEFDTSLRRCRSTNRHNYVPEIPQVGYKHGIHTWIGRIISQDSISYMHNGEMKLLLATYSYMAHNADLIGWGTFTESWHQNGFTVGQFRLRRWLSLLGMLLNMHSEYRFSEAGYDDTNRIYCSPNHIHGAKVTSQNVMLFPTETTLLTWDMIALDEQSIKYYEISLYLCL
jgi:hypothetical protein